MNASVESLTSTGLLHSPQFIPNTKSILTTYMKFITKLKPLLLGCLLSPALAWAQGGTSPAATSLTLEQCVDYALENGAAVENVLLNEAIGEREIRANLSGWYPQISASFGGSYNIKPQQFPVGDQIVTSAQRYNSNLLFEANQNLFNSDLLLASKAARFSRLQLDQQITNTKINTVVEVSKAFYDVLLTQEQYRILNVNLVRQEKQYNDARSRYEVGLVDKTDYQRAAITLANIRSDIKRTQEGIKAKTAYLKQLMGYPIESDLDLVYDYELMEQTVLVDTATVMEFANRIELQQLQTQRQLLELNTAYNKWSYLPTVSAFINYNSQYYSSAGLEDLYNKAYPTSVVGLRVSLPIFQGMRRVQNVRIAQLQEERLDVAIEDTRKAINTEYQAALANYKADYTDWRTLQSNLEIAQEVYDIIKLQYDEGVKAYVDLVVAESELRATQINYYNALYNLLASKLDYQRALGNIDINP
ncbi:Outer membrane protein TolC [Pontibacter chinhatensis]|uniref:Outer membrane protein TolC n=2 Tax=Pontibacter chinhatensis TaxID=1436961 RepID=A0A1I2M2K6_9BACT|nr:Outer membrane protein TolC [Pontibacter chinhatensis]